MDESQLRVVIEKLPERPLLAGEPDVTMSLAGGQSKLAISIFEGKIHLPLRGAASTHILKPENDRHHATVENELLCMRLASKIGLPVAATTMAIAKDKRYLLVERYDRKILGDGRVERMHQEDFCQTLGYSPSEKYEARGGPGFQDMFGVLKRSRQPARDRLNLLDQAILACCIGDTDRHGKNFSMILTDGGPKLAPAYDLMSALADEGITRNSAMKIAGKNRADHIERRHWERFAESVGLSPPATVRRVRELGTKIAAEVETVAAQLTKEMPADGQALNLFANRIRDRAALVAVSSERGASSRAASQDKSQQ